MSISDSYKKQRTWFIVGVTLVFLVTLASLVIFWIVCLQSSVSPYDCASCVDSPDTIVFDEPNYSYRLFLIISGICAMLILGGLYILSHLNRTLHYEIDKRTKEFLEQTKKLKESEIELAQTVEQLEKINSVMVGRELKMIKMKKELNKLKKEKQ